MTYEELLEESKENNIYVIENANFQSQADGLINGDVIGLNKNMHRTTQRACVLAEELGHYHTTYGDILDQSDVNNRKQEYKARLWAYDRLIGLSGIISAHEAGCHSIYEMAEHLNVTEEFLKEALIAYKGKYDVAVSYRNYVIFFAPELSVMKKII